MMDIAFDLKYTAFRKDGKEVEWDLAKNIRIVSIVKEFARLLYYALKNSKNETNVNTVLVSKMSTGKFALDINSSTIIYPTDENSFIKQLHGINHLFAFILGV